MATNPWLKKNPLMSWWLSGANAVAGSLRGQATAAARRQTQAAAGEAARQVMAFWTGGLLGAAAPSRASKPAKAKAAGTAKKRRRR